MSSARVSALDGYNVGYRTEADSSRYQVRRDNSECRRWAHTSLHNFFFVQSALDGYNVSLLAYGQTGAGKTWSMMGGGAAAEEGIIPRSIQQILRAVEDMGATGWVYDLEGSFLEIYNEGIRDLLVCDKEAEGKQYSIRPGDAAAGCMLVGDLTSRKVRVWSSWCVGYWGSIAPFFPGRCIRLRARIYC